MLYGNKLGNLRIPGCFFSTTALSTMILLSARSFVRPRLFQPRGAWPFLCCHQEIAVSQKERRQPVTDY